MDNIWHAPQIRSRSFKLKRGSFRSQNYGGPRWDSASTSAYFQLCTIIRNRGLFHSSLVGMSSSRSLSVSVHISIGKQVIRRKRMHFTLQLAQFLVTGLFAPHFQLPICKWVIDLRFLLHFLLFLWTNVQLVEVGLELSVESQAGATREVMNRTCSYLHFKPGGPIEPDLSSLLQFPSVYSAVPFF